MNFSNLKRNRLYHVLAHLALFFYLISAFPIAAMAADATTKIKHKPFDYYTSGKRISVQADISDQKGVNLARLYFKNNLQEDYLFVPMDPVKGKSYEGVLPAPNASAVSITYLFLVVNNENVVVKSQEFVSNIDDDKKTPTWQEITADDQITLYSELPEMTQPPMGYTDSMAVDVVESGARFGVVVKGIYGSDKIAAAGVSGTASSATAVGGVAAADAMAASAATSGGTVTATSGMSALGLGLGIGAAVAAVAAGAAVASSSSGDDAPAPSPPSPTVSVEGTLTVSQRNIIASVIDHNSIQDDFYDMYLNGNFIGNVNLPVGGTISHNLSLNSGNNTLELRLTEAKGSGTLLTIDLNNGETTREFTGSTNHSWTVVAP